jgi:hypothetical protein
VLTRRPRPPKADLQEPKAEGVAEPKEEAEGVKEPPADDQADGVKEPPA